MSAQDKQGAAPAGQARHDTIWKDIIMGQTADPRASRFKPGQSGNPKWRPSKKVTPDMPQIKDIGVFEAALNVARTPVTITEAGVTKEVSMAEAVVRALILSALKGNPYAANKAMEFLREVQTREAQELERERALWRSYKENCIVLDKLARLEGRPPGRHLPHPDDVVIDPTGPVRFVGPMDEAGQRKMEQTIRLRDLLILQDAYDTRFGPRKNREEPYRSSARFFAHGLERSLPPRVRLTNFQWLMQSDRAERTPKLKLLKILYRGWRAEGCKYPRGMIYPSLEWGAEFASAGADCAKLVVEHASRGTPVDKLFEFADVAAAASRLQAIKAVLSYSESNG